MAITRAGLVADRLQMDAVLLELNPDYAEMAAQRIASEAGMMADVRIETVLREAAE